MVTALLTFPGAINEPTKNVFSNFDQCHCFVFETASGQELAFKPSVRGGLVTADPSVALVNNRRQPHIQFFVVQ